MSKRIYEFFELSQCLSKYLSSQNDSIHLNVSRDEATKGILALFLNLPVKSKTNLFNSIKKEILK